MEKSGKRRIIGLSIIGVTLICTLSLLYICRNSILHSIINKRTNRIEETYGLRIRYQGLRMNGVDEVILQELSIVPENRDTLLTLHNLNVQINFWKLITGNVEVQNVRMNKLNLAFIKRDSIANYDFLFLNRSNQTSAETTADTNYSNRINKLLNLLFGFLPENGQLNQLHISEQKDANFTTITIPSFIIKENHFHSVIEIKEDSLSQQWHTTGELNRNNNTLKTELYSDLHRKISLPYITRRFGAQVAFDTLSYSLTKETQARDRICLKGEALISGLNIYHKALSPEVIHLNKGKLAYQINIDKQNIELDSTTTATFNKLQFHPYVKAEKAKGMWHVTVSVNKPWFPANDLFSSLPEGLFGNLRGIETSGELAYHFLLDVNFAQLDSLKFESALEEKNFRIIKYGASNLSKISGEFMYTAYENGYPVRTFPIGPSWEHFTPLDSISPLLRMAVMQSEDGAFFYHHGFLPDAMREALIHDLKVKRFARGGSTISMQLIKNVFLNRNKNFARKLEEALIVWLIETNHLTSKERMYEVYLNIAEWGPLIYGIHEASAFYFDKQPSQLTAEESIFLASIIPKPKHFRNSFATNGELKENMEGYYRLLAGRLAKKGLMNDVEADSIRPDIKITGKARNSLAGETPGSSSPLVEE